MTADKEIRNFLNEIRFELHFFKNMYDWEYDFLCSAAKSYGIDPADLTEFIKNYQKNTVRKKRILKKVIDKTTGIIYPNLSSFAKEHNLKISKAYYWLKKYPEKIGYLEVTQ